MCLLHQFLVYDCLDPFSIYHVQGLTMALAWSGACVASKRLAPAGLEATMQVSLQ